MKCNLRLDLSSTPFVARGAYCSSALVTMEVENPISVAGEWVANQMDEEFFVGLRFEKKKARLGTSDHSRYSKILLFL